MIDRRDLIIGAASIVALGGAEALRPRTEIALLGDAKLSDVLPMRFGAWSAEEGGDIVVPKVPGSLADTLYNDQVVRRYMNGVTGMGIMFLAAYGRAQTDVLQLHRPESCYPAIGFAITQRQFEDVTIAPGVAVPAVALTAAAGDRTEDIVYWTRLGEYLPRTASDQRRDRLLTAMRGYVGDGILVRASALRRPGAQPLYGAINEFLADLVKAAPSKRRQALVGTQIAGSFARA